VDPGTPSRRGGAIEFRHTTSATNDPTWAEWSSMALETAANESVLAINALIYAEVSIGYGRVEELEQAIPSAIFRREPLPYEAAFLAGKAFLQYRRRGGLRGSTLPDFYIGAHAAVSDFRILTRDPRRYRTYFPTVDLIVPR
jgi:predicted nucleic acid-binding protein